MSTNSSTITCSCATYHCRGLASLARVGLGLGSSLLSSAGLLRGRLGGCLGGSLLGSSLLGDGRCLGGSLLVGLLVRTTEEESDMDSPWQQA